jgi:tyrosyl-tRNA synthetase
MWCRSVQRNIHISTGKHRNFRRYFTTTGIEQLSSVETVLKELHDRGLVHKVTNQNLGKFLKNEKNISAYAGYDPTADSLHIGNLLSLITLTHFKKAGIRPIALVGGATGLIGDPSGKSEERQLLPEETVQRNLASISNLIQKILGSETKVVNNFDWYKEMSAISFLRNLGKHFRLGAMLAKDSVKSRLGKTFDSNDEGSGMSFTEFSYQILQAYDFYVLYKNENCKLQIGGADQWGNICSGCDYIRKMTQEEAFGLTIPLLTTSTGKKIGKSEGNAIWLSEDKTSVYDFYQFFLRVDDADAIKFLKMFTFLPLNRIEEIIREHSKRPESRIAQTELAREVTKFVHGQSGVESAECAAQFLFRLELSEKMNSDDLVKSLRQSGRSVIELSRSEVVGKSLFDIASKIGVFKSRSEIRRLINGGGLYLNDRPQTNLNYIVHDGDVIKDLLILRVGKKEHFVIKLVNSNQ